MAHHAYFVTGEGEQGMQRAKKFVENELGIKGESNSDLIALRYHLFSVDDARRLADIAHASAVSSKGKVVILSVTRFFHEAQNALLKLFEEPPPGVTLILVIPTEGMLVPTLRSRLLALPEDRARGAVREAEAFPLAEAFLEGNDAEREKLVGKLVDRGRSDRDEEKQKARSDAVRLVEELLRAGDRNYRQTESVREKRELRLFLEDLTGFLPLLHTRSAPLKLIFEHLLIVIPKGLTKTQV